MGENHLFASFCSRKEGILGMYIYPQNLLTYRGRTQLEWIQKWEIMLHYVKILNNLWKNGIADQVKYREIMITTDESHGKKRINLIIDYRYNPKIFNTFKGKNGKL